MVRVTAAHVVQHVVVGLPFLAVLLTSSFVVGESCFHRGLLAPMDMSSVYPTAAGGVFLELTVPAGPGSFRESDIREAITGKSE
jgi:hypothetical protein